MTKTAILIPVYGQVYYTEQCLESILRNTESGTYEVFVIDNASRDNTQKVVRKFGEPHKIHLVTNSKNLGWVGGINQGMKLALEAERFNYICWLNNDVIVGKDWLKNMVAVMDKFGEAGIINPLSMYSGVHWSSDIVPTVETVSKFSERFAKTTLVDYTKIDETIGFCYLIRLEIVKEVGIIDENFGMGHQEEYDYNIRVREKGYVTGLCLSCYVWHKSSATFGTEFPNEISTMCEKNRRYLEKKWPLIYGKTMLQNGLAQTKRLETKLKTPEEETLENAVRKVFGPHIRVEGITFGEQFASGSFHFCELPKLQIKFSTNVDAKYTFYTEIQCPKCKDPVKVEIRDFTMLLNIATCLECLRTVSGFVLRILLSCHKCGESVMCFGR